MVLNRTLHLGTSWGGAAWAPTDETGLQIWLNAADLANLKQTIAGTTAVTTAGDNVGYIADLSGNNNHLAASADNTTRGVLGTTDYNHVVLDGSNDGYFKTSAPDFYTNGSATYAFAVRPNPSTSRYLFSLDDGSAGVGFMALAHSDGATATTALATARNDAGTNLTGLVLYSWATSFFDNTDRVIVIVDTGTQIKWYSDGAQVGTARSYTRSGALTTNQFVVGGYKRNGAVVNTASAFAMRFSGCLAYFGDKTAAIPDITTYLGALQGRSL